MADSYVCSKAKIRCSCGDKIATLTVTPDRTIWLTGEPQANISDHEPIKNIAPFGKCHTVAYPPTGAATAAAHGKLTPMPCMPNTPFPWTGGKNDVLLKGSPALLKTSKLRCIYGGTITLTFDGQSEAFVFDPPKEAADDFVSMADERTAGPSAPAASRTLSGVAGMKTDNVIRLDKYERKTEHQANGPDIVTVTRKTDAMVNLKTDPYRQVTPTYRSKPVGHSTSYRGDTESGGSRNPTAYFGPPKTKEGQRRPDEADKPNTDKPKDGKRRLDIEA